MKAIGTIIGKTPLTETSLIVHWCTPNHGLIKTVAKGARRPRSPFAGKIDLFYLCEAEIHPSKKSDLHILKDLAVMQSRMALRRDYLTTLAASYFVKILERVAEPQSPLPELDDLLNRALGYLENQPPDRKAILHYEKEIVRLLGLDARDRDPIEVLGDQIGKIPPQRTELDKLLSRKEI